MNYVQIGRLKAGCTIYLVRRAYTDSDNIKEAFTRRLTLFSIKVVAVHFKTIEINPYIVLSRKTKWFNAELKIFGNSKWDAWHIAQKHEEDHIKQMKEVLKNARLDLKKIKTEKKKYKRGA